MREMKGIRMTRFSGELLTEFLQSPNVQSRTQLLVETRCAGFTLCAIDPRRRSAISQSQAILGRLQVEISNYF